MAGNSTYGRRPLWQWILLYLIIGAIIYGVIYYFGFANKGYKGNTNPPSGVQQNQPGGY